MQNHIRNTNLRFNLDKDQQRRAWEYLQTMDRQNFKSYSQVISLALVDYFDRYYRTQADPYLETRQKEDAFLLRVEEAVERGARQSMPLVLAGNLLELLGPVVEQLKKNENEEMEETRYE